MTKTQVEARLERHASSRGRTTQEIEWRLWNKRHDCFSVFKTKRDALAMLAIVLDIEQDEVA